MSKGPKPGTRQVEMGGEIYEFPEDHPLDQGHKLLAMTLTKEDWAEYVAAPDPVPPAKPDTFADYQALPAKDRYLLDELRYDYHSGLPLVFNDRVKQVHTVIRRTMRLNKMNQHGSRSGILIDGAPTLGKTAMARVFGRQYERTLWQMEPHLFNPPVGDFTPVVNIAIPSQATPNKLTRRFANYLQIPHRGDKSDHDALAEAVVRSLKQSGTRLVILDNIHSVKQSEKIGQAVNDHLKWFLEHSTAQFVYVGVDVENSAFWTEGGDSRATTNSGRFVPLRIQPYGKTIQAMGKMTSRSRLSVSDKELLKTEGLEWQRLVADMEAGLRLYLHEPGSLARDFHAYLLERTQGRISSLSLLIRYAAITAIEEGIEKLDYQVLESVTTDEISQRAYDDRPDVTAS